MATQGNNAAVVAAAAAAAAAAASPTANNLSGSLNFGMLREHARRELIRVLDGVFSFFQLFWVQSPPTLTTTQNKPRQR